MLCPPYGILEVMFPACAVWYMHGADMQTAGMGYYSGGLIGVRGNYHGARSSRPSRYNYFPGPSAGGAARYN